MSSICWWLIGRIHVSGAAKDRRISRVTHNTSLRTFELHPGALIMSLNEDYHTRPAAQRQDSLQDSHLTLRTLAVMHSC